MIRTVFLLTLGIVCASGSNLRGEKLESSLRTIQMLPMGPTVGEKIQEFKDQGAGKRHLCWSCYG